MIKRGEPSRLPNEGSGTYHQKSKNSMKVALLNTTILTGGESAYYLKSISLAEARSMVVPNAEVTSYIGHESTTQIMSTLLGIPVAMNRAQFKQDSETVALCFKLNGRPAEGQILTAQEIEAIGYEWFSLRMLPLGNFNSKDRQILECEGFDPNSMIQVLGK